MPCWPSRRSEQIASYEQALDMTPDDECPVELSVFIPALNEGPNLTILLPQLNTILEELKIGYEVIVITKERDEDTVIAADASGALLLTQVSEGYGGALVDGFNEAKGAYVVTLDADLSHHPTFVADMWRVRDNADITIASRYVPGGAVRMPRTRRYLSQILNVAFRLGMSMPVHDLSSGFRLYRASTLDWRSLSSRDFDVLEEILVKAYSQGHRVQEIPFNYMPRAHGSSTVRMPRLARAYLRSFWRLWKLRNSIEAADYDDRAYDSVIPLQRYWQRQRHRIVSDLITGQGPVLDVGCGSSRIVGSLPPGSVALDVLIRKVRYARKFNVPVVHGSGFELPFPDESFPCVLSSQVIEHVPKDSPMIDELCRVLRSGGRLVVGTPDYARREWVYLEKLYARLAPGGYADEHIAHYTRRELIDALGARGFVHEATRYIMRGELIMAFRRT
jgi:dolichol-phosphate mannosyltransferase